MGLIRTVGLHDPMPALGLFRRQRISDSELLMRFPVGVRFDSLYDITVDEFRLGWWMLVLQCGFQRTFRGFVLTARWGYFLFRASAEPANPHGS
jgi:hypothetical protein